MYLFITQKMIDSFALTYCRCEVCGCFAVGQHSHQHAMVVSSFVMCEGGGRTGLTELEVCGAGSWTKVYSLAGGISKFLLLYS